MDAATIIQVIADNLLVPVIAAIGGAIIVICNKYTDKLSKSIVKKNNIDQIGKEIENKTKLVEQITAMAKTAVQSNMQLADKMKATGNGLTEEQAMELKESAKTFVLNSLPMNISASGEDTLLSYFGSQENLEALITSLIEKAVYEDKIERSVAGVSTTASSMKAAIETQPTVDMKKSKSKSKAE